MPAMQTNDKNTINPTSDELMKLALARPGIKEAMEVFLQAKFVINACQLPAKDLKPCKEAFANFPLVRAHS